MKLGCEHGRRPGQICPHCEGIGTASPRPRFVLRCREDVTRDEALAAISAYLRDRERSFRAAASGHENGNLHALYTHHADALLSAVEDIAAGKWAIELPADKRTLERRPAVKS